MSTSYSQTEDINGDGVVDELDAQTTGAEVPTATLEELTAPTELVGKSEEELLALEKQQQAPGLDPEKAKKAPPNKKPTTASTKFPCDPNSPTLQINKSHGEKVKQLQKILKSDRFYTGAIDGIFGPGTEAAVKDFQTFGSPDVPVLDGGTGIVGPETWKELCELADFWNKNPQFAPKI